MPPFDVRWNAESRQGTRRAASGLLSALRLRIAKWLVILPLLFCLGTPWLLLQSVAWVSMLIRYSQDAALAEAAAMTFDGRHPCQLCRIVQRGQAHERQKSATTPTEEESLQLDLPPASLSLVFPRMTEAPIQAPGVPRRWSERPPTPPPRRALWNSAHGSMAKATVGRGAAAGGDHPPVLHGGRREASVIPPGGFPINPDCEKSDYIKT